MTSGSSIGSDQIKLPSSRLTQCNEPLISLSNIILFKSQSSNDRSARGCSDADVYILLVGVAGLYA